MTRLIVGRLLILVALGIVLSGCTDAGVRREHATSQTLSSSAAVTTTPIDVTASSASPTHDASATGLPSTTAAILSAPGWQIMGQAHLSPLPTGDKQLRADVHGPAGELTRSDGGIYLMWHIMAGPCDKVAGLPVPKVLYRNNFPVTSPTQQTFTLTIPSAWNAPALSLAAFANVNGTGRLAACADLPSHP